MTGSPIPYFFGNDNLLQLLFLLDILGIAYVFGYKKVSKNIMIT